MYYSKSTNGFYSKDIHGKNIPNDAVVITKSYHITLLIGQTQGKVIVANDKGYPVLEDAPTQLMQVPSSVTMRQARLALHSAGLLSKVEELVDSLTEPTRTVARIEWDYANNVYRDSEFVQMMSNSLKIKSEELDTLFITANSL